MDLSVLLLLLLSLQTSCAYSHRSPPLHLAMTEQPTSQQPTSQQSSSRGFVSTPLGRVHYTTTGSIDSKQTPILAFHMSPRSVDEYTEAIPLLSSSPTTTNTNTNRLIVAMDELGYGASDNPTQSCTLDEIADCFLRVADQLNIRSFVAVGSLMGCYFGLSLASRYPDRVKALVCTNLFYFTREDRQKALVQEQERLSSTISSSHTIDSWTLESDGSHIANLWKKRSSWLNEELNTRVVLDEMQYLVKRRERYSKGIHIQDAPAFNLESAARSVTCPVLCVKGEHAAKLFAAFGTDMNSQHEEAMTFLESVECVDLEGPGSSINLVNQMAPLWADHVLAFLDRVKVDE